MLVRRTRRAAAVAAGLVFLSVMAACEANPSPAPLPSESPSPSATRSASSSPTVAAPTLPAEAKGTSEASAKAFVRHWIETLNYAGPSRETRQLKQISAPGCAACTAITDLIDEVDASGGYIRGSGWTINSVETLDDSPGRRIIVEAQVSAAPQDILQAPDEEVVHFDGGDRLKTFWLLHGREGWAVTRLDQPE